MKLVKTDLYLLLIDEEAEIKEGNYRVHIYEKTLNHPVHRLEHGENTFDTWKLVLAYYPLTKEAKKLDLLLLPDPFEKVDIEKLAKYHYGNNRKTREYEEGFLLGFDLGYKAASKGQFSLDAIEKKADIFARERFQNSDKTDFLSNKRNLINFTNQIIQSLPSQQSPQQFSLEDMETLMEEALNWFGGGRDKDISDSKEFFEKYIQSLSTQQLPKEFIPEYDMVRCIPNGLEGDHFKHITTYKIKTITNSEGKEELVGGYRY